jgi:hypothetical protein
VAIFAAILGPTSDLALECLVHWLIYCAGLRRRDNRAFALRNSKARPTFR